MSTRSAGAGIAFKAEDIRLQRTVDLKFLPANPDDSVELKERFLGKAEAAAAPSRSSICVIHEVGDLAGAWFKIR